MSRMLDRTAQGQIFFRPPQTFLDTFINQRDLAPPGLHLVVGPYELPGILLYSLTDALRRGAMVYWVDCGNRFEAYGISKVAQAQQMNPKDILKRIQLARPFSAYQLNTILSRKFNGRRPPGPVILSDPLCLFYDDQMPQEDAERAFRRFTEIIHDLTFPVLTLAVRWKAPPQRTSFSKRLTQAGRTVLEFDMEKDRWLITKKVKER